MRAHFTPQAEIDLEEVGDYIALDNPGRAVSFIREIRQHCEKIADGPNHYVARPDLGDAIRICVHGNYLIVTVGLTVKLARPGTELPLFKCLRFIAFRHLSPSIVRDD